MAKKRTRASNGMGSIRLRKDGRWEGRYTAPDGKQRSVYGKTEAECTKKLRGALHEVDTGSWREPSRMTVADWFAVWLRDYQSHTTGTTVRTYTRVAALNILPVIGPLRMSSLSKVHIRRVVSLMQQKSLSPSTITLVHSVLSGALNDAVEAGIINGNPASGIKLPRIERARFTIVDRDMFPAFIAAAQKKPLGNAIIFALMTGLRSGELRGLCWDDVDFDVPCITVRHQLAGDGLRSPKGGKTRTVVIPPDAVAILRNQRKLALERRLKGLSRTDDKSIDLVFKSPQNQPIQDATLRFEVHAVGAEIGLPKLHPHDLRHSYAVAALRSGIDVKTVQHNLGHRTAAMTLDVYAGYTDDAGKTGAERFSAYWNSALNDAD